jgi:purine-binding chemotaxis protein CheW
MKHSTLSAEARAELLKQRAARLAVAPPEARQSRLVAQVALVGAGTRRFGIPVEGLREIVPMPDVTPLPGLPPWMLGLAHLRGEIMAVLDLGVLFGEGGVRGGAMAVVEGKGGLLGLSVATVLGFRDVHEDDLSGALHADTSRPVRAVTKDLVMLIDIARLPSARDERR